MPRAATTQVAQIEERLAAAGIALPAKETTALSGFLDLLTQWNQVYNLTGIREIDELIERHLVESLALRELLRGERIADVGTGAGLPGVPLAIAESGRSFTLIESRVKRVRFLRHVIGHLGLTNTTVAHGRAESLRPDRPFDTVLARAVAPPAQLLEICRHLTAPGSILLLLTSAHLQDEFRGLAADFVVRPVATPLPRLRASIVLLERV